MNGYSTFPFLLRPMSLALALLPVLAAAETTIDIGSGQVNPDSFRLGEYNGLHESGSYLRGSFNAGNQSPYTDRNGTYWSFSGSNVGLGNAGLQFRQGAWGRYALSLDYQGMPHYRFDGPVQSPFRKAGSANQYLPADWVAASSTAGFASLAASLDPVSIHTDREHLSAALLYRLNPSWTLSGEFQQQRKQGNDTLGAIFGSNGGNPRGAVLAAPVDYVTDNFSLHADWQSPGKSLQFGYQGSLFRNDKQVLRWQNPFDNNQWAAGAGFSDGAWGQLALSPDNQFHNIAVSGIYGFADGARLSGNLKLGRMTQDEMFLPYSSVFTASDPLPAFSLQGSVRTLNGNLNYATRLSPVLSLRARYSIDVRDNDTERHLFQRIAGDVAEQATLASSNTRLNRPYSHGKQKLELETAWRLGGGRQLQLSYRYSENHRDFVDVDRVRENAAGIKYLFPFADSGKGSVELESEMRRGSAYQGNEGFLNGHNPDYISTLSGNALYENDPLLRRFHLADRNREQLSLNLSHMLGSEITLAATGRLTRDDFPASQIGLQSSDSWRVNVNANWAVSDRLDLYAWQGWQSFRNQQNGYSRNNRTPFYPADVRLPANNWQMDIRDRVLSSGLGLDWESMDGSWQLQLDASLSDANSATRPSSSGLENAPFPDFSTRFATLSGSLDRNFSNGKVAGVRYRYDDYHSNDFTLDNVVVDSLSNVLLLGNSSPVYAGAVVEIHFRTTLP